MKRVRLFLLGVTALLAAEWARPAAAPTWAVAQPPPAAPLRTPEGGRATLRPDVKHRDFQVAAPAVHGRFVGGVVPKDQAFAEPNEPYRVPDTLRGESGEDLYEKCVKGIAYLTWPSGADTVTVGSGSIIDASRRLVLTAAHVVQGTKTVTVCFPKWDGDHVVIDQASRTSGKVLKYDLSLDLAVVQLEALPPTPTVLAMAAHGARPGAEVVCIGHPVGGARWSFNVGNVRNVEDREWQSDSGLHKARVLLLQNPINPGDSGGPVLNRNGEIVGINHGKTVKQGIDLIAYAIALDEVEAFVHRLPGTAAAEAEKSLPVKPLSVKGPQIKIVRGPG